jgi:xanthine dehydrogenase YagR molybdenum-binding subunit
VADAHYAWPTNPKLLSTHVKRLDGPDKVTGRARYTYDINRPGMLYGVMIRSPHPHARIVSIDLAAAQKAPGVKAALTAKEPGARVMYQGDPVAAVAADSEDRARDAARLVKVEYERLPHVSSEAASMAPDAPAVFTNGNTRKANADETGDLDAGFKQAAHIVEATYATHVITHVCLETHGAVCEWDGDTLTAWVSTQGVHQCAQGFAQSLQIPQTNVRVITQYMGGGFGSKFAPDMQGLLCAKLARAAKAPVKLMLDRKEEHLDTGNRPSAFAKIRAGVDSSGRLTAFDAQSWGTGGAGATSNFPLPETVDAVSRKKWNSQVLPAAAAGKSKVASVVMSVVRPDLKILPAAEL